MYPDQCTTWLTWINILFKKHCQRIFIMIPTYMSVSVSAIQPPIHVWDINIQWLKGNTSNTETSRARSILHQPSTSTVSWSAYLLAGEPMITLWIRMPYVTSGKDGSLNFNSAMMLKQRDGTETHLVLDVVLPALLHSNYTGLEFHCRHFWSWSIYLGVSVSIITPMYRRFVSDSPNQESWRCTKTGCVKIKRRENSYREYGRQKCSFWFLACSYSSFLLPDRERVSGDRTE